MVVLSRHNIRSPLTSGAAYQRVTPYEWFKWSSPGSQLSLRGGVLETEMGQFFRKWVVSEGLLPDNYRPEGDEVLFYANSRQRTFATAKYFSAGFLPFANVEITHKYQEDKMDPLFTPQFTKMNDTYRQQVLSEMQAMNGGPQAWMTAQQPTITLLEEVLNMAHSPAAENDTTHFWYDDTQFKIEKGDEPKMTGGYTLVNSVADALVLQCYESESMSAFGHELTMEQWRAVGAVKEVYDALLFTTHAAAVNLAYPLVSRIREELNNSNRKFMFLCGHDSNLASIGAALRLVYPETENAIELHTHRLKIGLREVERRQRGIRSHQPGISGHQPTAGAHAALTRCAANGAARHRRGPDRQCRRSLPPQRHRCPHGRDDGRV